MDPVKEAFSKVKQDIALLQTELHHSNTALLTLSEQVQQILQQIQAIQQTNQQKIPTLQQKKNILTEPYNASSTGNEGVPTNQQTNQPTNQHTGNEGVSAPEPIPTHRTADLTELSGIVSSYQEVQKQLKKQVQSLTKQEFTVYATIYQLQLEQKIVDYPAIAEKLHLSEISARDYVLKLLKKGVPLTKTKQNNKKIILSIPSALTAIASLPAMIALYER